MKINTYDLPWTINTACFYISGQCLAVIKRTSSTKVTAPPEGSEVMLMSSKYLAQQGTGSIHFKSMW